MLDSRPLGTFPEYTGTSADKASSLVDEIDEDALLFTHVSRDIARHCATSCAKFQGRFALGRKLQAISRA